MTRNSALRDDTYHDPLDSFIDREEILKMFRRFLRSAQPGHFRMLALKGNGGTGKTFLISYLIKHVCPKLKWQSGQISFAQVGGLDFRFILGGLEDALSRCVPREFLKQYRDKRDEYYQHFDNYRTSITIQQLVEVNSQSSISGVDQNIQVNVQLRERELQLRSELTRNLIELAEKSEHPLCLFIDNYEVLDGAGTELVNWLLDDVLLGLATAAPQPLQAMMCGRDWPSIAVIEPLIQRVELTDFDQEEVRKYLIKLGVFPSNDSASSEVEELVATFYERTRGLPLFLSLAVTYFKELDDAERTASGFRANMPLVDYRAIIDLLAHRLMSNLPEPYHTLLERGPILRFFDKASLQALLNVDIENEAPELSKLDDKTYEHFLQYSFIKRHDQTSNDFIFHDEIRRTQIDALRKRQPQIKEKLHYTMANFYGALAKAEREERLKESDSKRTIDEVSSEGNYAEWLVEISEKEFKALLEFLYHGLQVKELQVDAFEIWREVTERAVDRWRRRQAGLLLETVRQLMKEGEPYLSETNESYGQYLISYSRFLEQEAHWEEAQQILNQAVKIFEHVDNPSSLATCFNNLGTIDRQQGKLEQALSHYQRALALNEQVGNPSNMAISFNNLGTIDRQQGKLEQALSHYQRALALSEQVGNPADIAISLNSIGIIYQQQGELEQALSHYQRALALSEQVGNPAEIAQSLNNMGGIYHAQGKFEQALSYYGYALALSEQVGNPAEIAQSLNNMGGIYHAQGKFEQALSYYERALLFREQVSNPSDIAQSLNNIGFLYFSQKEFGQALSYYNRALALYEHVGNPVEIGRTLNNIGSIYHAWGKARQSLRYLERALELSQQLGNPTSVALCLNNIGIFYQEQGQLEKALLYHEQALEFKEQVGNSTDIAQSLNSIGVIYQQQGKLEDALHCFERALVLKEQVSDSSGLATSLNNIGFIYQQQGKLEDALYFYERALAIREQVGNPADIALSLHNLGTIYAEQERWERAIAYYTQALNLYENLGQGFESDIVDELETLAACYVRVGETEKGVVFDRRAKLIGHSGMEIRKTP